MILFRAELIAALLIGLGALGGPAWAQYDAPCIPLRRFRRANLFRSIPIAEFVIRSHQRTRPDRAV